MVKWAGFVPFEMLLMKLRSQQWFCWASWLNKLCSRLVVETKDHQIPYFSSSDHPQEGLISFVLHSPVWFGLFSTVNLKSQKDSYSLMSVQGIWDCLLHSWGFWMFLIAGAGCETLWTGNPLAWRVFREHIPFLKIWDMQAFTCVLNTCFRRKQAAATSGFC